VPKHTALDELRQFGALVRAPSGRWHSSEGRPTFSHCAVVVLVRKGKAHITQTRDPAPSDYGWCRVPCRVEPCGDRVLRGGSCFIFVEDCRISFRFGDDPGFRNNGRDGYGFRPVAEVRA
jgi:formylglycine-generating enzyme required for sulfatase activity